MNRRAVSLLVLGALVAPVAGVALATPSRPSTPPVGLTSQLLARGAAGEFRLHDEDMGLKLSARRATDVAVVQATLAARGTTGWHRHPGPSLVVVKTGALTMIESEDDGHRHWHGRRDRGCTSQVLQAGSAFVHPEHAHTFVNETDAVTEFYVVYMVPAGAAPLLTDVTPAPECE